MLKHHHVGFNQMINPYTSSLQAQEVGGPKGKRGEIKISHKKAYNRTKEAVSLLFKLQIES